MPDTATAPTMTPAQLRAAGSRLLGFYLGGGGAKVDALVETAHLLTKDASGRYDGDAPLLLSSAEAQLRLTSAGARSYSLVSGAGLGFAGAALHIYDHTADQYLATWNVSGYLGLGTPAASEKLEVAGNIRLSAGANRRIRLGSATNYYYDVAAVNDDFRVIAADGAQVLRMNYPDYNLMGYTDNVPNLGHPSLRWGTLYAGTGTINTSDERFKIWLTIGEDRAAKDRRIARRIFGELGWYQFTDAVTEKGADGARWHYGARAQRVWAIVADEGLAPPLVEVNGVLLPDMTWTGPVAPAWLTFDSWNEQWEDEVTEVTIVEDVVIDREQTGVLGPDGAEILKPIFEVQERVERAPTGERVKVREAGHVYGFRVDEMTMLLAWSLHDRLAALEPGA